MVSGTVVVLKEFLPNNTTNHHHPNHHHHTCAVPKNGWEAQQHNNNPICLNLNSNHLRCTKKMTGGGGWVGGWWEFAKKASDWRGSSRVPLLPPPGFPDRRSACLVPR